MYKTTQKLIDGGVIPPSFAPYILKECPDCHMPIYRSTNLKSAHCGNLNCINHLSERADTMFKYLGLKGIGAKTCKKVMLSLQLTNHLQLIPVMMLQTPTVYLWEVAMFCFIPGYSKKMEDVFEGYKSFVDFFNTEQDIPVKIKMYKDELIEAEQYFKIKPPLSKDTVEIVMTGEIYCNIGGEYKRFKPRDSFVDFCNSITGELVKTKLVGKKQSADFVVTNLKESTNEKFQLNLPHLTPNQYLQYLTARISNKYLKKGDDGIA